MDAVEARDSDNNHGLVSSSPVVSTSTVLLSSQSCLLIGPRRPKLSEFHVEIIRLKMLPDGRGTGSRLVNEVNRHEQRSKTRLSRST